MTRISGIKMEFGTGLREETADCHAGRLWRNGTLEAWWSRGTTDLKVASQPPRQPNGGGPCNHLSPRP